jgi:hypothetical protein
MNSSDESKPQFGSPNTQSYITCGDRQRVFDARCELEQGHPGDHKARSENLCWDQDHTQSWREGTL